jgi:hypothetical protein
MASNRFEWAKSLLTGGVSYMSAAALTALSQTPNYPRAAELGAFAVAAVSGVNYFFSLTTIISPDQRQLLFDS